MYQTYCSHSNDEARRQSCGCKVANRTVRWSPESMTDGQDPRAVDCQHSDSEEICTVRCLLKGACSKCRLMRNQREWRRHVCRHIKTHWDGGRSAGIESHVRDVVAERVIHAVGACSTTSWRHRSGLHIRTSGGSSRKVCRDGRLAARADKVEAGRDRRPVHRCHACAGIRPGRTC